MLQVVYGRQPDQKAYGVLEHKKNWLEHLEMAKGRFIESSKTVDCCLTQGTVEMYNEQQIVGLNLFLSVRKDLRYNTKFLLQFQKSWNNPQRKVGKEVSDMLNFAHMIRISMCFTWTDNSYLICVISPRIG